MTAASDFIESLIESRVCICVWGGGRCMRVSVCVSVWVRERDRNTGGGMGDSVLLHTKSITIG